MTSEQSGPAQDPLDRGIVLFNEKRYFEAHEVWEDLWRGAHGEIRAYYQGLVQVAVGLHHMSHGNLSGGRRVLERGLQKLLDGPGASCGLDNTLLMNDIRRTLETGLAGEIRIRVLRPKPASSGEANAEQV